jgi:beta-glucanase (GH16 family)
MQTERRTMAENLFLLLKNTVRVLVVDDEPAILWAVRDHLNLYGILRFCLTRSCDQVNKNITASGTCFSWGRDIMYKFFREVFMRIIIVLLFLLLSTTSAAPPPGYSLVWSDEFDSTTIDTNNWSFDVGGGPGVELEYYNGLNFTLENGSAVLWAKHEKQGYYNYTSCQMNTRSKKEFKYGYIEMRLKAPEGQGLYATLYLLGSDYNTGTRWPDCGEIELYDQKTGPRLYNGTPGDNCFNTSCDFKGPSGGISYNSFQYNYNKCLCTDYHLYAIEWDSLSIKYFFDDNKIWEYDTINASNNFTSFHQPFYFITGIAIGGEAAGFVVDTTIFPQKMYIDYVRVYQRSTQVKASPQKSASKIFTLSNPSQTRLKVYNLQGRLVADYTDKVRHLMKGIASNLPIGIYVTRLFDGVKTVSEKLVIQK